MTDAERAQAELNEFYGTKPLPASEWQKNRETKAEATDDGPKGEWQEAWEAKFDAARRLVERGEMTRDEYAAALNGDITDTLRSKVEQEMQSNRSTNEGGFK